MKRIVVTLIKDVEEAEVDGVIHDVRVSGEDDSVYLAGWFFSISDVKFVEAY